MSDLNELSFTQCKIIWIFSCIIYLFVLLNYVTQGNLITSFLLICFLWIIFFFEKIIIIKMKSNSKNTWRWDLTIKKNFFPEQLSYVMISFKFVKNSVGYMIRLFRIGEVKKCKIFRVNQKDTGYDWYSLPFCWLSFPSFFWSQQFVFFFNHKLYPFVILLSSKASLFDIFFNKNYVMLSIDHL